MESFREINEVDLLLCMAIAFIGGAGLIFTLRWMFC